VNRGGDAVLSDFGLSSLVAGIANNGSTTEGSYRWSAPELFQTNEIIRTAESDVYAFGCVCLEV
jgi:serine/threonine protein kinase